MGTPVAGRDFLPNPSGIVMPVVPINPDDDLVVTTWQNYSVLNIIGNARVLTPGGLVDLIPFSYSPAPTGSASLQRFNLPPGYLLDVSITVDISGLPRGAGFVQVALAQRSGSTALAAKHTILIQESLVSGLHAAWPGGRILSPLEGPGRLNSSPGTNPAAGAEITEAMGTLTRALLRSFSFTLVTSAAVATRQVHLIIDDGTTILLDLPSSTTQTASLTRKYYWAPYAYAIGAVLTNIYNPIPVDLKIPKGGRVRTVTDLLDAGDDYSAPQVYVESWGEPSA